MVRISFFGYRTLAKADYHIYCSLGRFFAASELKAILCHILLNYDVKMANGGGFEGVFGISLHNRRFIHNPRKFETWKFDIMSHFLFGVFFTLF